MKYILVLLSLLSSLSLFATAHLVDNTVDIPGVFKSLQTAIDAASEGDTLFVKGTFIDYGEGDSKVVVMNKRLVIIGEGAYKTEEGAINEGEFTLINRLALGRDANGSTVQGIHLEYLHFANTPGSQSTFSDFDFYNNQIDHITQESPLDDFDGITFVNNRIYPGDAGFDWSRMRNLTMKNNFLHFRKELKPAVGDNLLSNNMIIVDDPSLQIDIGGGLSEGQWKVENVTFHNNTFYMSGGTSPVIDRLAILGYNSIFKNNLAINAIDVRENSNGEITNTVSVFFSEEEPFIGNGSILPFTFPYIDFKSTTTDFHLKDSSQGKNAGLDGKDIGIYGGEFPWPDGPNHKYELGSALSSSIPFIELLETNKTVVKPGEGLKVRIKARVNN